MQAWSLSISHPGRWKANTQRLRGSGSRGFGESGFGVAGRFVGERKGPGDGGQLVGEAVGVLLRLELETGQRDTRPFRLDHADRLAVMNNKESAVP